MKMFWQFQYELSQRSRELKVSPPIFETRLIRPTNQQKEAFIILYEEIFSNKSCAYIVEVCMCVRSQSKSQTFKHFRGQ